MPSKSALTHPCSFLEFLPLILVCFQVSFAARIFFSWRKFSPFDCPVFLMFVANVCLFSPLGTLASLILRLKFNISSLYFQPFLPILLTSFATYFKAYSVFVQTLSKKV